MTHIDETIASYYALYPIDFHDLERLELHQCKHDGVQEIILEIELCARGAADNQLPGRQDAVFLLARHFLAKRKEPSMSSIQDYVMMMYPRDNSYCVAGGQTVALEAVANQIQEVWSNVHPDHQAALVWGKDRICLRYDDGMGIFQLMLYSSERGELSQISMRFAYSNPESILAPFCRMIEWLMTRYDMKANSMRPVNMRTGEPFEQTEVSEVGLVGSVYLPQMKMLWNWWQKGMGGKIAMLASSETDKLLE